MKFNALLMSFLAAGLLYVPAADAAPSAKRSGSSVIIKEAVDDNALAVVKESIPAMRNGIMLSVEKINDADLLKLCQSFPDMVELKIGQADHITSLAPLAGLTKLRNLEATVNKVTDFTPLAGLTSLERLNISSEGMGGDLKWMSGLTKLKTFSIAAKNVTSFEGLPALPGVKSVSLRQARPADLSPIAASLPDLTKLDLMYCQLGDLSPLTRLAKLDHLEFYGATVADFSPLAACPALKYVGYYATKDADYSTLKALQQIERLNGGLTKLADIAWVAEMPKLKEFNVFAEYVTDYSPLAKSNIEKFTIWNMREPVGDLASVGQMPRLRNLKLWSAEGASNSAALASLANLEMFTISNDYNKKGGEAFDLAATAGWNKVTHIDIQGTDLMNADKVGDLPALNTLTLRKVNQRNGQAVDLSGFAKAAKLRFVSINDCSVANFEALAACTKITRVSLSNVKGITSLDFLKSLPDLNRLEIAKCPDIPDSALQGFSSKVKIAKR